MSHAASALDLLDRAHETLVAAYAAESAPSRYLAAELAARCAAAALVASAAARGGWGAGRSGSGGALDGSGPRDLWVLAVAAAPDLAEWAGYLGAVTVRCAAVGSGATRVSVREADDLVRGAEGFVDLVMLRLGLPVRHDVPHRLVPARSA